MYVYKCGCSQTVNISKTLTKTHSKTNMFLFSQGVFNKI